MFSHPPLEQSIQTSRFGTDAASVPYFNEHWTSLYELSVARIYPAGEELFRQGAFPRGAYFIASGYVKLTSVDTDGRQLIIGLRSAGSILGAASVILEKSHPVSATTVTSCTLRYISSSAFISLLKEDAHFSWLVQLEQSRESYERITRIVQLGCGSARQRLAELLCQLISANPVIESQPEVCLHLPLKQWEVAQLIAVTPEHLNRIVRQMQREEILRWTKSCVVIPDWQRLRQVAGT